jgi:hypothetical protein
VSRTTIPTSLATQNATTPPSTTSAEQAAANAASAKAKSETVEIEGVVYRNYFFDDQMHLLKNYNFYSDDPILTQRLVSLLPYPVIPYFRFEKDWVFRGESSWEDDLRNRSESSWAENISKNIYCPDDEWENTQAHYANPKSYMYYYKPDGYFTEETISMPTIDPAMFDDLLDFSDGNIYVTGHHVGQTRKLPKAAWNEPHLVFYKESIDGLLVAHTGEFFVWEGEFVLFRYLNDAGGDSGAFVEVSIVPEALGQYFMNLIDALKSED